MLIKFLKTDFLGNAFTLIEVLLALAILGIGLVSVLSIFVVGANSVRRSVETTEASFIAQMVLEEFKRIGHQDPNNITNANIPAFPSHYGSYTALANVSAVSGISNIANVDLTVSKGNREIAEFTTYITKYEP